MELRQLQIIIEGALLAAGEPLSIKKLETLFDEEGVPERALFEQALAEIAIACEARGFELKEVATGWRFQVREELAPWVNRLWEEKPQKYSRALLETLSLIAYRQPITRGDIEEIRGVAVSSHIIKTLTEREWVKVVGQRDVPGRPSLYATTRQFLDYFNLKSLDQLPTLSEIRDIDEINSALDLGDSTDAGQAADAAQSDDAVAAAQELAEATVSDQGDAELDARETVESASAVDGANPPESDMYATDDDVFEPVDESDQPAVEEASADTDGDFASESGDSVSSDDEALTSVAEAETDSDERSV
ncbi:SMC-Scp complex subunit ScpB [Gilvimarinus sp. SDUM040013]|uniref:SMC-Scp complex subunit ScpB n=1 Tax=Gilvimarinus gilvus TaxID=3058038 RepID=A0ABU4RXT2_9GAMM|nr:SMC-Scp complex subunit ScpB [Gilvimarinus sp. SDUM040013]MDO3386416.1 SMC-Scp complex subunit ScpB [Gilvimarinus sp. SDUM040013]MDX6849682.1 SMC-Scp complex subunit ScpB [Gilvimarinus sp. SDUM040013]